MNGDFFWGDDGLGVMFFFVGVVFWHQKMRVLMDFTLFSKQRNHVPNVDIYQGFSLAMYLQPRGNCHLSTVGMTQERKGWGILRST